ncbi:MAG: SCO family protein [Chitinophagales bacterium]|nr:SCO family protein [Chitinophagales bacterium]
MKWNKGFIGGLAVAFLLPLSFYIIAKVMSKDKIFLPDYYIVDSIDTVQEDGATYVDTNFHKVADITLINQFGKPVSVNKDLSDKIVVVNFFFTTCPTVCPQLTQHIKMLQKAFKKNDTTVQLVSITVDPERDSFPAMRQYADRNGVDHDHWYFLTGSRDTIYNYAYNELHVVMGEGHQGADDFIHSQKLILLDKDRHIRGYYDGLDTAELRRCADDIILLTLEKKHKRRHKI